MFTFLESTEALAHHEAVIRLAVRAGIGVRRPTTKDDALARAARRPTNDRQAVSERRAGIDHEVRATVVARGEASNHYLQIQRSLPAAAEELAYRAAQFASELEDFVAESGSAWGSNESPDTRFRQRDQADQPAA